MIYRWGIFPPLPPPSSKHSHTPSTTKTSLRSHNSTGQDNSLNKKPSSNNIKVIRSCSDFYTFLLYPFLHIVNTIILLVISGQSQTPASTVGPSPRLLTCHVVQNSAPLVIAWVTLRNMLLMCRSDIFILPTIVKLTVGNPSLWSNNQISTFTTCNLNKNYI